MIEDGKDIKSVDDVKEFDDLYVYAPQSYALDLLDIKSVMSFFKDVNPDIVLHIAAKCGGIGCAPGPPRLPARL